MDDPIIEQANVKISSVLKEVDATIHCCREKRPFKHADSVQLLLTLIVTVDSHY